MSRFRLMYDASPYVSGGSDGSHSDDEGAGGSGDSKSALPRHKSACNHHMLDVESPITANSMHKGMHATTT